MVYVVVIGGKWFDKVNGNTYHNAKVIVNGDIFYSGFQYGYGSDYLRSGEELVKKTFPTLEYIIVNGGSFNLKKSQVKNGWF